MQRYKVGFGSVFSGQFRAVCINMLTYIMADHVSYFVDFYSSPACGCELYKQCNTSNAVQHRATLEVLTGTANIGKSSYYTRTSQVVQ